MDNIQVVSIPAYLTHDWILNKHYSRRLPTIQYSFGMYVSGVLEGVITFGPPASRPMCKGICGPDYQEYVIELNRLVANDGLPPNCTSKFVSMAMKLIPGNHIVVSFADTQFGHIGFIYQATNFIYTGLSVNHLDWIEIGNETHSRSVCRTYTQEYREANPERFTQIQRPQKHRYIYFLGDKKFKKQARGNLRYSVEPYPKGDTIRHNVEKNINVFQAQLFSQGTVGRPGGRAVERQRRSD
jgi:hypothetical protein